MNNKRPLYTYHELKEKERRYREMNKPLIPSQRKPIFTPTEEREFFKRQAGENLRMYKHYRKKLVGPIFWDYSLKWFLIGVFISSVVSNVSFMIGVALGR